VLHVPSVNATSLGMAHLVIKTLEFSLVPTGGRCTHGIHQANLCIYLLMYLNEIKI
jgi:hypothetical protein